MAGSARPAPLEGTPYRSMRLAPARAIVLPNNPRGTPVVTAGMGLLFALAGSLLSPFLRLILPPSGAEVAMSGMSTVFVLVGVSTVVLGLRMRRSATALSVERDELTVRVRVDTTEEQRFVVPLADVEDVGVEVHDDGFGPSYRAQIRVRGQRAIALGDRHAGSPKHYERMSADIRRFLD